MRARIQQQPTKQKRPDYLEVLTALEKAANFFSKIRLSLNKPLDISRPYTELSVWYPPRFFSQKTTPVSKPSAIPCYQISFQTAESLENPETLLNYQPFVVLKNYYAAKRFKILLNGKIPIKLIYAHEPEKLDKFAKLDLQTTKAIIKQLSSEIQGFWSLEYSEKQQVKIPAILGQLLLEEDLSRKIQPIHLHYRNYVMGDKTGDPVKSYAPRYYILDKDYKVYTEIAKKTKKNLLFYVRDKKFLLKCKEGNITFKQLKREEEKK